MISNLVHFLDIIDEYVGYLESKGVVFNEKGFPILNRDMFLEDWPEQMVTYGNRNARFVRDKKRTVLCFYCSDELIYRRLDKVFEDIPEYLEYLGAVSSDISVIRGMEREWEDVIMLLNQLFMAVLAINGIKVVLNLRSGSANSINNFSAIPKDVMCASGTLGCDSLASEVDFGYLSKVLSVRPSKLLIYGKKDPMMEEQLDIMGISYRRYDDVHRAYMAERRSASKNLARA